MDTFATALQQAVDASGVTDREIACHFEVIQSSVARWRAGLTRPHPRLQTMVLAWVSDRK